MLIQYEKLNLTPKIDYVNQSKFFREVGIGRKFEISSPILAVKFRPLFKLFESYFKNVLQVS